MADSTVLFTRPTEAPTGDLATADVTTFTTAHGAFAIETTVNGAVSTITSLGEVVITNSADFASIVSAESASRGAATNTASTSNGSPTETGSSRDEGGPSTAAIAGGVVGALVFLLVALTAAWFLVRRQRRRQSAQPRDENAQPPHSLPFEKAQLHSNDIKPSNELPGSGAPQRLLERKFVNVVELPANEEVARQRTELPG